MITELVRLVSGLLLLPSFIVAAAILIKGYSDVGDGFSAGVIAALGMIMQYLTFGYQEVEKRLPARYAPEMAAAGMLLVLGVTLVPLLQGLPPLTHFPGSGEPGLHLGKLEIHTAILLDLGIALIVLGFSLQAFRLIADEKGLDEQ